MNFKPATETKDDKINPNLALYKAFQDAIYTTALESATPFIWNTQRQMGKSTMLARLAANALRKGDVWYVSCTAASETYFVEKVKLQFKDDAYIRSTKTKIEYATPDKVHVLVSPHKFHKLEDGITANQPVLVIIDEMQLTTVEKMDWLVPYLDDPKKTKLVATGTGISSTDITWCSNTFGIPEIVSIGFASADRRMKALTGTVNAWEIKD
jgi:hypothetical protein